MPTAKNKKHKPSPARPFWRRKLFWFFVVLVVLIGAGTVTPTVLRYREEKAISADRVRFQQADRDVQQVADAIIAATGQPYEVKESKSCSRRSTKYEKAPIVCRTSKDLFYSVESDSFATNTMITSSEAIDSFWKLEKIDKNSRAGSAKSFSRIDETNTNQYSYQLIVATYANKNLNMSCRSGYNFYTSAKPPFEEYISTSSKYVLAISVDCSDEAKAAHYKLRQ